jgi:AraC-like DNA-binding protein
MPTSFSQILTVSRDHLRSQIAGAVSCGLKLEPLLRRAGIAPAQLENPAARTSHHSLSRLRLDICRTLDDETAGFFKRPAPWGSTVLFCHAIMSSRTLREVLLRYERFSAIVNEEVRVAFVDDGAEAYLDWSYDNLKDIDIRAEIESRAFFLLSLSLWLIDRRFVPLRIEFGFPVPEFADDYVQLCGTRYIFGRESTRLVLKSALLREPVRQTPRALKQFLANHLTYLINHNLVIGSVADRVRRVVQAGIGFSSTLDTVSRALNIAPTTLRRRLKAEGAEFQAIKDDVRQARARHYLLERRLSVRETAELTGFGDPASFSRAFKSWTGLSPQEFTRRSAGGQ